MKLIWATERRDPDTWQRIPDTDRTSVADRGYGPVQGTRFVRLNQSTPFEHRNAVICVDLRDLWQETPEGLKAAEL